MFEIDIKPSDLNRLEQAVRRQAEAILQRTAAELSSQTYGKAVELAQEKLHSSRDTYLENLELVQESDSVWIVRLHPDAMWIEEGMDQHEMINDLLFGKKGKQPYISKDGLSRYKVIPIKLNKAPTRSTQAARELQAVLKRTMKEQKIPYGGIEKGPDGQPLQGRLHKLDIMDAPLKTHHGVGQGHGPIGEVRQGTTGIPLLQAVNVFQKQLRGMNGRLSMSKDIMTFRVVSTKQIGSGKWVHPGVEPKKIIDQTFEWAKGEWETQIKPQMNAEIQTLVGEQS